MRIYFGIKYHKDYGNGDTIEKMISILNGKGYETSCIVRDCELGKVSFTNSSDLMLHTFGMIDSSDMVVIEFSEKGVGLGIEAGYAFARGIPVITVAKKGAEISETLEGISKEVIFYDTIDELRDKFPPEIGEQLQL